MVTQDDAELAMDQDRANPYVEAMAKMLAATMPLAKSDLLTRREHPPPPPPPPPALRTSLHGSSDVQARRAVGDQHINGGDDGNYFGNQSAPLYTGYVQSGRQLEVPTTALEPQLLLNMLPSPVAAPRVLGGFEEF